MMSTVLVSRSVPLPSPIKTTDETSRINNNIEKQGIVAILGNEITNVPPSLKRSLSADMSSRNLLSENVFGQHCKEIRTSTYTFTGEQRELLCPMKRIASSQELAPSSTKGVADDQENVQNMPSHDDIWRAIQSQKEKKDDNGWSSLLSEKAKNEANNLLPPYVHPLVKKQSTLNEKSLEICTESLGSETGSDKISFSPSETGDIEEDCKEEESTKEPKLQENEPQMQTSSFDEEVKVVKYNYDPSKKMAPKAFPPPLPSLVRKDGNSLHMGSHRTNGRLVLEAFSVPQMDYFQSERVEGRLVLTLFNSPDSQDLIQEGADDEVVDFEEVFDNFEEIEGAHEAGTNEDAYEDEEDEDDDDEVEMDEEQEVVNKNGMNEMKFFMEQSSSSLPTSGMLNVHRSALMMKSLMGLGNRDPTWSNKLNKAVELMEEQVVAELTQPPIPQSLPPQQQVARLVPKSSTKPSTPLNANSSNAYEYFWRNNNNTTTYVDQRCGNLKGNNKKVVLAKINHGVLSNDHQESMVLVKGNNGDYLVPFIKGCKENRRSLLYWQPHCIATS